VVGESRRSDIADVAHPSSAFSRKGRSDDCSVHWLGALGRRPLLQPVAGGGRRACERSEPASRGGGTHPRIRCRL